MYQNCAQSAVQNELKTSQFQQSGHAYTSARLPQGLPMQLHAKPKDKTQSQSSLASVHM